MKKDVHLPPLPPPKADYKIHQELNINFPLYCYHFEKVYSFIGLACISAWVFMLYFYSYFADADWAGSLAGLSALAYVFTSVYYFFDLFYFKIAKAKKLRRLNDKEIKAIHLAAEKFQPIQVYIEELHKIRPYLFEYDKNIINAYIKKYEKD